MVLEEYSLLIKVKLSWFYRKNSFLFCINAMLEIAFIFLKTFKNISYRNTVFVWARFKFIRRKPEKVAVWTFFTPIPAKGILYFMFRITPRLISNTNAHSRLKVTIHMFLGLLDWFVLMSWRTEDLKGAIQYFLSNIPSDLFLFNYETHCVGSALSASECLLRYIASFLKSYKSTNFSSEGFLLNSSVHKFYLLRRQFLEWWNDTRNIRVPVSSNLKKGENLMFQY